MIARRTKELARLGHISCGYHLIDITYYGYSIYISFHHALCDGRGVMPFIETLIYYYCDLKYGRKPVPEGVRLADDPLLPGETDDPFLQEYDFDEKKTFVNLPRDGYAIPENVATEEATNYRYEVKISGAQYMKACKEHNATPVILLALLMSRGIAELYPEYDKPVNANIAADMRDALGVPNTFKNCVKSMNLPYSREFSEKSLTENAQYISEIHLYNSGTTGLGINMISCGENFVLDFKQNFQSDKYVRAFCEELEKLGIAYTVSDRIPFVTPGDSIIKR